MRKFWTLTILYEVSPAVIKEVETSFDGRAECKRAMDRATKKTGGSLVSVTMRKPDGVIFMRWDRSVEHGG